MIIHRILMYFTMQILTLWAHSWAPCWGPRAQGSTTRGEEGRGWPPRGSEEGGGAWAPGTPIIYSLKGPIRLDKLMGLCSAESACIQEKREGLTLRPLFLKGPGCVAATNMGVGLRTGLGLNPMRLADLQACLGALNSFETP